MDIYSLFESKDMREYLRKIGYKFSTEEAAFLVYVNDGMTIKQKHAAWQEIIDTMPNCSLDERFNMKAIPDFHGFLRKYMKLQNRLLDDFYVGENCVWQYKFFSGDYGWEENDGVYKTYSDCFGALEDLCDLLASENIKVKYIDIIKRPFATRDNSSDRAILSLNADRQPISITPMKLDGEDDDIYNESFDGMWFDFPTPFKHGDIVVSEYGPFGHKRGGKEIFVLHSIDAWTGKEAVERGLSVKECREWDKRLSRLRKNGDIMDMTANGYFLNDDGKIYGECMHAYCNLEFYRGELKDEKRVLGALSSYLKGELDICELLDTYIRSCGKKSLPTE